MVLLFLHPTKAHEDEKYPSRNIRLVSVLHIYCHIHPLFDLSDSPDFSDQESYSSTLILVCHKRSPKFCFKYAIYSSFGNGSPFVFGHAYLCLHPKLLAQLHHIKIIDHTQVYDNLSSHRSFIICQILKSLMLQTLLSRNDNTIHLCFGLL